MNIKDSHNFDTSMFYTDPEVYEAVFHLDQRGEEIAFWKKWASISGKSVLELCCGTGLLSFPLIKSGFDYIGIDLSESFLSYAQEKITDDNWKCLFSWEDARNFDLDKKFHLIMFPFNSISHLYSYNELGEAFNCIRKHLFKKSYFIIDLNNPNINSFIGNTQEKRLHGHYKTISGKSFSIYENNLYDGDTQINRIVWNITFEGKKRQKRKNLLMRIYYPQEILALLEYNGFKICNRFGGYNDCTFNKKCNKHIIVAQLR